MPPEGFEGESALFNEVINMDRVDPLELLTATEQQRVDKLRRLRHEVEIRGSLLSSALGRYITSASIVSITSVSNIEMMDETGLRSGMAIDRRRI